MMKPNSGIAPLAILFALIAGSLFLLQSYILRWGADVRVLHLANILLFAVACISAFWMSASMQRSGATALLKALYGGFMIRFFVLAGAAFIYILSVRKQVNLPGLIGAAIFYLLYLFVEIRSLRTVLKSSTHA